MNHDVLLSRLFPVISFEMRKIFPFWPFSVWPETIKLNKVYRRKCSPCTEIKDSIHNCPCISGADWETWNLLSRWHVDQGSDELQTIYLDNNASLMTSQNNTSRMVSSCPWVSSSRYLINWWPTWCKKMAKFDQRTIVLVRRQEWEIIAWVSIHVDEK